MRNKLILNVILAVALGAGLTTVQLPTANAASTSKRVQMPCCELRVPSSLRYRYSGSGIISVGGSLLVSVDSLEAGSLDEAYQYLIESADIREITYREASSQWAVASGFMNDGTIFYIRTEFDRGCGEAGYLIINFPKSQKKSYTGAVSTMSKSFRADLCG
jgi:hypothetical protein